MTLIARYRDSFAGLPRPAWLLAAVLLINTSGTMVVFFMALYLTRHLGWPAGMAGLAMSGYGVGMLAGTLTGGLLSDRLGAFRVQRLSLTGTGILLVGLAFLHDAPLVLGAIVVWGFFSSALYPSNTAAMAAVCPPDVRPRGFVLNRLAANLGVTIGPVVGGFLAQQDYRLLFWVDGVTCLLAAFAALRFFPTSGQVRASDAVAPGRADDRHWWEDRVFLALLAVSAGTALVITQIFSTYGVYLKQVGLDEAHIGGLIAVNTSLIVVAQMPLVHAIERFSRTRVAAVGALLLGAGFGSIPFAHGVVPLAATVVVWTFGEMLTLPLLTALVSLRASPGAQGRYQGLFTMSYSLGSTLGPVGGTWVLSTMGGRALWSCAAGTAAAVAGGMFWLSLRWNGKAGVDRQSRASR
jgi:MFS family permease